MSSDDFKGKSSQLNPHHRASERFTQKIERVDGLLVHTVMFNFHRHMSHDEIATAVDMCRALKNLPGVLAWTVQKSLDNRKGCTVLELGLFENGKALIEFRNHPSHIEFTEYVKNYADWNIVDFPTNNLSLDAIRLLSESVSHDDTDSEC